MDWLGSDIDGPLVVVRALHFAVTAMTTGILVFRTVVADAAFGPATPAGKIVRAQTLQLACDWSRAIGGVRLDLAAAGGRLHERPFAAGTP